MIQKAVDFVLCVIIGAALSSIVAPSVLHGQIPTGAFTDYFLRYLVIDSDETADQFDSWIFNGFGDPLPAGGGCGGCWSIADETDTPGQRIAFNSQGGNVTLGAVYSSAAEPSTQTMADTGDGSPQTLTFTPDKYRYVEFVCNDVDTCDVTLGEPNGGAGGVSGQWINFINTSANVVDLTDTAGVTEMAGNFAMGQWDSITMIYQNTYWVEMYRSDN